MHVPEGGGVEHERFDAQNMLKTAIDNRFLNTKLIERNQNVFYFLLTAEVLGTHLISVHEYNRHTHKLNIIKMKSEKRISLVRKRLNRSN